MARGLNTFLEMKQADAVPPGGEVARCRHGRRKAFWSVAVNRGQIRDGVNTPWRRACDATYSPDVKHQKMPAHQIHKPADAFPPTAAPDLNHNEMAFAPSPDEVARRAYGLYMNRGSLPGQAVQHWLAAEAEWLAECQFLRLHGSRPRT